jgi:hypothetical protein
MLFLYAKPPPPPAASIEEAATPPPPPPPIAKALIKNTSLGTTNVYVPGEE